MSSFPQTYPSRHVYPMKAWKKTFGLLLGIVLTLGGAFYGLTATAGPDRVAARISTAFFLAAGIYMLAWVARARLVLDGTRIEVRGAFREQSAELGEIEGYRTVSTRYGTNTLLYRKDGLSTITIRRDFDTDESYQAWLGQLVDLDVRDRENLLDEISKREDLGATPKDRMAALATAKTLAIFSTVVTAAAAIALNLHDDTLRWPSAAVLTVAPFVVIFLVRRSPLLYTVFRPKRDPRADLGFVLIAAGAGLLFRVIGFHLVAMQPVMWLMILLIAVHLGGLFSTVSSGPSIWARWIGLLLVAGLYSYSMVVLADTMPDHSRPAYYATTVVGKHLSQGRSTSYILDLAPWGPMQKPNTITVSSTEYNQTALGDQVCMSEHPGALHAPWYTRISCEARTF